MNDHTICPETASGAHELHGDVSTVAWDRRTGELRPFALRCNELVHPEKGAPLYQYFHVKAAVWPEMF